jgi:hypothetical protein
MSIPGKNGISRRFGTSVQVSSVQKNVNRFPPFLEMRGGAREEARVNQINGESTFSIFMKESKVHHLGSSVTSKGSLMEEFPCLDELPNRRTVEPTKNDAMAAWV